MPARRPMPPTAESRAARARTAALRETARQEAMQRAALRIRETAEIQGSESATAPLASTATRQAAIDRAATVRVEPWLTAYESDVFVSSWGDGSIPVAVHTPSRYESARGARASAPTYRTSIMMFDNRSGQHSRALEMGADITARHYLCENHTFEDVDMTRAVFDGCSLRRAKFMRSNLTNAQFNGCDLRGADFTDANLTNCSFNGSITDTATTWPLGRSRNGWDHNLSMVQSEQVRESYERIGENRHWQPPWETAAAPVTVAQEPAEALPVSRFRITRHDTGAQIFEGDATSLAACAQDAVSQGVSLAYASLRNADLSRVNLRNANFSRADLRGANFQRSVMSGAIMDRCNIRGADLRGATWEDVSWSNADTTDVRTGPAPIIPGHFDVERSVYNRRSGGNVVFRAGMAVSNGDFQRTDLTNVNLTDAVFVGCRFTHGVFASCNLTNTRFENCEISGANFTLAITTGATFSGCYSSRDTRWNTGRTPGTWSGENCTLTPSQIAQLRSNFQPFEPWHPPWEPDPDDELCQGCDQLEDDCQCNIEEGEDHPGTYTRRERNGSSYLDGHLQGGRIYGYSTNVVTGLGWPKENARNALCFGVELEMEPKHELNQSSREVIEALKGPKGKNFICKSDGSLRDGVELVTLPYTLEQHSKDFGWFTLLNKAVHKIAMSGKGTDRCGIHIHINKAALSALTIGKMLVFANSPKMERLITTIAQRASGQYCQRSEKKVTAMHPRLEAPHPRYDILNVGPATIEVRMFRGNLRPERVVKNIEFCHSLVSFCRDASIVDCEKRESYVRWLLINRGKYPYLVKFLRDLNIEGFRHLAPELERKQAKPALTSDL